MEGPIAKTPRCHVLLAVLGTSEGHGLSHSIMCLLHLQYSPLYQSGAMIRPSPMAPPPFLAMPLSPLDQPDTCSMGTTGCAPLDGGPSQSQTCVSSWGGMWRLRLMWRGEPGARGSVLSPTRLCFLKGCTSKGARGIPLLPPSPCAKENRLCRCLFVCCGRSPGV